MYFKEQQKRVMKGEYTYCEDSGQKNNYLRHNILGGGV